MNKTIQKYGYFSCKMDRKGRSDMDMEGISQNDAKVAMATNKQKYFF